MIVNCSCCNRKTEKPDDHIGDIFFCSIECACFSGRFSIREGWINSDKPIKRCPPKQSWNMTDEFYEKWIAELGWVLVNGQYQLKETNSNVD